MSERTHEVVVHKAGIPLAAGESLGQYMSLLNSAVKEHAKKKIGGGQDKNLYPYMIEAYADSCVIDLYTPSDSSGAGGGYKYYSIPYTRKDGTFSFGAMTEVIPVKTFQPVTALPLASNTTGASVADASSITSTKAVIPGSLASKNWIPTEKRLFAGVL
jgi:hypothetical protein